MQDDANKFKISQVHDPKLETALPVRKIPKNYLGVTGGFASRKNNRMVGFESLLEKDQFILLEFDDSVVSFEEQPVKVPLSGGRGRASFYVPDVLIRRRQTGALKPQRPILAEIKPSENLKKHKADFAKKFAAARQLAAENGWVFQTRTERDIRGSRLDFLKFLREYHCISPDPDEIGLVIDTLRRMGGKASYAELIEALCPTDEVKLQIIPVVWHLVATNRILVDYNQPVSDAVALQLPVTARTE